MLISVPLSGWLRREIFALWYCPMLDDGQLQPGSPGHVVLYDVVTQAEDHLSNQAWSPLHHSLPRRGDQTASKDSFCHGSPSQR